MNPMSTCKRSEMDHVDLASERTNTDTSDGQRTTWQTSNSWPPLKDGGRSGHAIVTVSVGDNKDHLVVIGGWVQATKRRKVCSASVAIMDIPTDELTTARHWKEAPPMNEARATFCAVSCRSKIYAIGGMGEERALNSIEYINIADLLKHKKRTSMGLETKTCWQKSSSQLKVERAGCSAAVIENRYIVVVGGYCYHSTLIPSVDIVDTNNPDHPVVKNVSFSLELRVPRASKCRGGGNHSVCDWWVIRERW